MRKGFFILLAFLVTGASYNNLSAAVIVPLSATTTEPDPAKVKAAVAELKGLSKKERKLRVKEARQELKALKAAKKQGNKARVEQIVLIILAILLPPLSVYLHQGEINNKFWISLLLTLLFILPGIIYALIVVTGND